MTKLYAQRKDVFDINKVTVVGNPTITSDGVASGLNKENLIKIYFPVENGKHLKVKTTFKYFKKESGGIQPIFWFYPNANINNRIMYLSIKPNGDLSTALRDKGYVSGSTERFIDGKTYTLEYETDMVTYYKIYIDGVLTISQQTGLNIEEVTTKLNYIVISAGLDANETTIIEYDLTAFKIYIDGELVYSPTKPVYALERRKPKLWNKGQFTIVGNPSISDDGWASGFGASNYIKIPKFDISKGFVILEKFRCNSVVGSQTILSYTVGETTDTRFGVIAYFESSGKISVNTTSNGTSFAGHITSTTTILPNVDYILKLEYDGTKITMYLSSDNGITFIQEASKNIVLYNGLEAFKLGTGAVSTNANSFINGSIDLKSIKIYTDNTLVFDGGADTYVYDPSKFTVVGSPTITEYGVASGLSQTGYLTVPFIDFKNKAFSYKARVKFNSLVEDRNVIFGEQGKDNILPLLCMSGKHLRLYTPVNGTRSNTYDIYNINVQLDTWYDIELLCNLSNIIVKINGTEIASYPYSGITYDMQSTVLCLGTQLNNTAWKLDGSNDLTQFSITVDGKEVFTGAKEKFYAMRGM